MMHTEERIMAVTIEAYAANKCTRQDAGLGNEEGNSSASGSGPRKIQRQQARPQGHLRTRSLSPDLVSRHPFRSLPRVNQSRQRLRELDAQEAQLSRGSYKAWQASIPEMQQAF